MKKHPQLFPAALCIAALLLAGTALASAAQNDPPVRVARLAQIAGKVSLEPAGANQWTQAVVNTPLTTGDRLYVDHDGHTDLQMGQLAVRAWKYTDLTIANLTNTLTQLGLTQGSLHVRTFTLAANHNVEVDTPNGAITVVQPGDFRLDAYTSDGGTLVTVDSGEVQISGPKLSQVLGAGQSIHLVGSNPIRVISQPMPGKDPFDVWSLQRDRVFLRSKSRDYVNPDTIGSDDLEQYGTWEQTLEYGPVWYPANVPVGWSPYSSGRWVWVSPWGWTWVDRFAWGFAPFHYGRWTDLGSRWGWIPGPLGVAPIYSPAMVAFVGGAGFTTDAGAQLSGWFPLGPGEPFYPSYFCTPRYFTQVNLTNIRNMRSIRHNINASNYSRYYHTRIALHSIRHVNQKAGTIAVPADEFAAGQGISPDTVVRPTAQQWTNAQILPHPMVAPTLQSLVPHPVSSVPVPAERPNLITLQQQPEVGTQPQATPDQSSQPQEPGDGRRLIARTAPAATGPGFEQMLPALSIDPGRPLDPGQVNNLAQGLSAGPASTSEFPIHPTSASGAAARSGPGGRGRR